MKIRLLGSLEMIGPGGKSITEDALRSSMLTKLMTFILFHHQKNLPVHELIEALWPDDTSDNPIGALKNLIYRLRNALKKTWGNEQEFILTGEGSYYWNPGISLEIDSEQFEYLNHTAAAEKDINVKLQKYKQAVELYRGMFMARFHDVYWIASSATYFHSLYLSMVKELSSLLEQEGCFEEMEEICSAALVMEPLDEELHSWLIRSLMRQNKRNLALEHYQKAVNILYENLGIDVPGKLHGLYDEMMKQTHSGEASLNTILNELREDEWNGVFFCEYGIFKQTYKLEARRAERLGISVYLLLITVVPMVGNESSRYQRIINRSMEKLQKVFLNSLRSGDVVSRYSKTQYILLLPTCQYETAKKVMERIERGFYKNSIINVRLQYSLNEIA